jgi:hypothetical protein
MKNICVLVLSILFLNSCGSEEKRDVESGRDILINGITLVELNIRANPYVKDDNVLDALKLGDSVQIVSFNDLHDDNGVSWCEIKLEHPQTHKGKALKYAWVAYKLKALPTIVSNNTWDKIKRMYEMDYESGINEMLTGSATWLTQAVYDYVYTESMNGIKYTYENIKSGDNDSRPLNEWETESPSHSIDYTTKNSYPQYCRSRITSASIEKSETALYAVVFNQTPRTIHFFRQDNRSGKGSFARSFDFSRQINSSIKSLQRKTSRSKLYYTYEGGYEYDYNNKYELNVEYDVIRIRLQKGRDRYYVYNNNNYTNSDLSNLELGLVKEY